MSVQTCTYLSILYSHCTCTILLQYNSTKTESFGSVLPLTGTLGRQSEVMTLPVIEFTVAGSQPIVHLPMVRLTIEQQVRGSILALLGHIAIFLETGGILPYFLEPGGFVLLRNHFVIT